MRRTSKTAAALSLAPWIVAGFLLLGGGSPVSAQDATPSSAAVSTEATVEPEAEAVGGTTAPSTVPATGVGSGLMAGGTGPLSLGALVGAGVAVMFALRERLKNR